MLLFGTVGCSVCAGVMRGGWRCGYDSLDIRKLADGAGLSEGNAVLSEVREGRCVIGSEVVVR